MDTNLQHYKPLTEHERAALHACEEDILGVAHKLGYTRALKTVQAEALVSVVDDVGSDAFKAAISTAIDCLSQHGDAFFGAAALDLLQKVEEALEAESRIDTGESDRG